MIPSLILFLVYAPDSWLLILILTVNILSLKEFFGLSRYSQERGIFYLSLLLGSYLLVHTYYRGETDMPGLLYLTLFVTFLYGLFIHRDISTVMTLLGYEMLGLIYISFLLSYVLLIDRFEPGRRIIIFTLIVIWCVDASAYYVGRRFGKRRLSPQVSPKKTIEGAIGGLLGGILSSIVYWFFFLHHLPAGYIALTGICIGVIGQLSDLYESLFKRWAGTKDSGRLFPGHGGMLDRVDSLLFTFPFIYYLIKFNILH